MPIIFSYPQVSTVSNQDLFVISRAYSGIPETKSVEADDLASYVTTRVNLNFLGDAGTGIVNLDTQNLSITGTANEIETAASSQTLQIGLPDNVTIANNLTVSNDLQAQDVDISADLGVSGEAQIATLTVDNDATMNGNLEVNNKLTVSDNEGEGSIIDSELSMSSQRIINLSNPVSSQDAVTKSYVDTIVSGGLNFRGSFRADTGEILSGANTGSYLYNCPGGAGTRVSVLTGDYYIVANAGGNFYCSGDLLNVGDSIIAVADAAADSSTVTDWATLESDNIEGTGLANTIPLWTDSQVLGNSIVTQTGTSSVRVSGELFVINNLELSSDLLVGGGTIDMAFGGITNLATPAANDDATTKVYVDTEITNTALVLQNGIDSKVAKAGDTMSGVLNMGSNKITSLSNPTAAQDAATKAYVDASSGSGGAWTTLEVNLSGNVLANAFNGNLSDAITLVTVPANHFAKILEVTGVIYGATSGTTDYNSNNSLYVKRVGSVTGGGFSAPEILGNFINSSSDQLTNSNGQPVAAQVNALNTYGGLGADVVLGPSTTGPVTITQGDRTIKLSVTYRLIDFTP